MPKKILLADDSITIQKVIGLTFANEDVTLTVVDNGDEALIKAREVTPDLIIADVVMPGKDGYEVCYSIKHDPNLKHVPVLLLTGTFETFDETMANKVGANGFITKPFESQALIDKVNELIGQAHQAGVKAPSINDLMAEPAGLDAGLPAADELGAGGFDGIDPVEPLEDIAPMELEEVQPVEDNPLEKFASLEPDPEESSFADVSLEEPAPAMLDSFDDLSPAEPEPEPETAPVAATPPTPALAASAPAGDDGWNMNDFGDYMAEQTDFSGLPADDEPTEMVDMTEPSPLEPAAESIELGASAVVEELEAPDAFDLGASSAPVAEELSAGDSFDLGAEAAPADADLPASEGYDLGEAPQDLPVNDGFDLGAEAAPEAALESFDLGAMSAAAEAPAAAEPAPEMPLESVADMYPLDEAPESAPAPVEPAPAPTAVEISSFDEPMQTESLASTIAYEPPPVAAPAPEASAQPEAAFEPEVAAEPAPAAAPVAAALPAAAAPAPGVDAEALQRELGRIPEIVESRLRAVLETNLMSQVSDHTAKVIEGQIEEAIRKVAPSLIQQLVDKAIADATERILNETIGRLRK